MPLRFTEVGPLLNWSAWQLQAWPMSQVTLYGIQKPLAHGKSNVLAGSAGPAFQAAAQALPIVKLLARCAVERCASGQASS